MDLRTTFTDPEFGLVSIKLAEVKDGGLSITCATHVGTQNAVASSMTMPMRLAESTLRNLLKVVNDDRLRKGRVSQLELVDPDAEFDDEDDTDGGDG